MKEGLKIGARLKQDIKIVKKMQEKESWAGIATMNPSYLDASSAYRTLGEVKRSTKKIPNVREQQRKKIIDDIH